MIGRVGSTRQQRWARAFELAVGNGLDLFATSVPGTWAVTSASDPGRVHLVVEVAGDTPRCDCLGWQRHDGICSHVAVVLAATDSDEGPDDPAPATAPEPECRKCHGKGEWMETIGWRGCDIVWHRCPECRGRRAA